MLVDLFVGFVVWMFEKIVVWIDSDGDFECVFGCDGVLDDIILYWVMNMGVFFVCFYWENNNNNFSVEV